MSFVHANQGLKKDTFDPMLGRISFATKQTHVQEPSLPAAAIFQNLRQEDRERLFGRVPECVSGTQTVPPKYAHLVGWNVMEFLNTPVNFNLGNGELQEPLLEEHQDATEDFDREELAYSTKLYRFFTKPFKEPCFCISKLFHTSR